MRSDSEIQDSTSSSPSTFGCGYHVDETLVLCSQNPKFAGTSQIKYICAMHTDPDFQQVLRSHKWLGSSWICFALTVKDVNYNFPVRVL